MSATNSGITARNGLNTSGYGAVTPSNLNTAVTAALTDDNKIIMTDAQKASACETIGACRNPLNGWVLKLTMTSTDIVSVDLTGCSELLIYSRTKGTGSSSLKTNIETIINTISQSSNQYMTVYARFADTPFGIECVSSKARSSLSSQPTALFTASSDYCWCNGKHISDIRRFSFGSPSVITSCEIEIYAR